MVRSLWTGATGMIAQQLNVDNIAHNLSNVNTTGYKSEAMEFKSLLYQTIQTKSTTANMEQKPIGAEVGLGVRNSSITSIFTQGSLLETPGEANFAIAGNGFFAVKGADGETTYYTRNGNFEFAIGSEGLILTTSDGLPVLDTEGESIIIEDEDVVVSKIQVSRDGTLMYPDDNNVLQSMDMTIGLWQFNNPGGLSKEGDSLFIETDASGEAMNEAENDELPKSKIIQGYLEGSNVQVADEMVNLIVAQRAYEMNSKVITTSDEMLQQANQLKR
ncbi:MAG: flagellar hook-basal body protein [Lachnospiraceae bacterium]|nr:flagellar hook-basal body protein [Lachnospiraceae bacterium]